MTHASSVIGVLFLSGILGASQCNPKPVSPVAAGGALGFGGSGGSGGSMVSGGSSSVGGSSGPTSSLATSVQVEFPACFPAGSKRGAFDRSKVRLGRRPSALKARRKASYLTAESAVNSFWRPLLALPLDQGDLGSCTGNAQVIARLRLPFALETLPSPWATWRTPNEFQALAVDIYKGATLEDPFPGAYPPDDTGSDVASASLVSTRLGLFTGYRAVTTLAELQIGLNHGPCVLGVDWFDGFFSPSRCGEMSMIGPVMGGHSLAAVGDDVDKKLIWTENSWGQPFGVCLGNHCGFAAFTYGTMSELLARNGEAYCPTPPN